MKTDIEIAKMIVNMTNYLSSKSLSEIENEDGMDAFDLTFAMSIFTGISKEKCMDMFLHFQDKKRIEKDKIKNLKKILDF